MTLRFDRNKQIFILAAMMLPGWVVPSHADTTSGENIVQRIHTESNGNVIIEIDTELLDIILTDPEVSVRKKETAVNGKVNGYRIQVFSDGRNQSSLEARAKARGNAIVARFPKYRGQVYTFSSAPNWYTRIGNFRNEEEARKALDELKRSFPNFSSEMRVVKSKISVR